MQFAETRDVPFRLATGYSLCYCRTRLVLAACGHRLYYVKLCHTCNIESCKQVAPWRHLHVAARYVIVAFRSDRHVL